MRQPSQVTKCEEQKQGCSLRVQRSQVSGYAEVRSSPVPENEIQKTL
jgi:hypothetical protein